MKDRSGEIIDRVWEMAGPICDAQGLEMVHVEYQREPGGRTLRVYIDKPGGVSINDCAYFSRQLGDLLDVYLEHENAYNLEVSSPGTDRPIGKRSDYERFQGCMARIKTARPLNGQKNFKGILLGFANENIKLRAIDDREVEIPYQDVVKARLVDYSGDNSCS